jgi:hypothetical protein
MSVRRPLLSALLALVLGLLAAFAVACGDDGDDSKLLGPRSADRIRAALDDIEDRVARGRCDGLGADLDELSSVVVNLPGSVDAGLRRRLREGTQHLRDIAREECEEKRPETTETQPETTETVPPATTETVPPATTETVPPETTTQPPPETEQPVPPEEQPEEPILPEDSGGNQAPSGSVPPGQAKKDASG